MRAALSSGYSLASTTVAAPNAINAQPVQKSWLLLMRSALPIPSPRTFRLYRLRRRGILQRIAGYGAPPFRFGARPSADPGGGCDASGVLHLLPIGPGSA